MDLRRTTIRSAALTALLAVLPLTAAAQSDPDRDAVRPAATLAAAPYAVPADTPVAVPVDPPPAPADPPPDSSDDQPVDAAPRARQLRTFFWMNALRSNHDRHARATAGSRMRTNVAHLRRGGIDFGVLAETAPDQRRDFRRLGGDTWALVGGGNTIDNVVFYRRSAFAMVGRESLTIRYVHGERVRLTVPVLRDRVSGGEVAVIPVHNPRLKVGPWRRISLEREVAKVQQLRRRAPGRAVVIAGDFNAEWTPACAFTRIGLLSPIATEQHCHRTLPIDQMYATPELRPHGYRRVHTTATDHHSEYHVKLRL